MKGGHMEMGIQESFDKMLNLLNSLKDDTNDALNNTPYILRRLSEFTDGELGDLISNLEEVRDKVEEMEVELNRLKETADQLSAENEK
jgi:predicted nuclease with TOPRIM domain